MEELAGAAGVSQPTVMRFVKALGYSGFREFKYALVQEEARGQRKEGEIELYGFQLSSRDRLEEIPGKIVATSIRMLEETLKSIRAKDYRQAVEAILEARSIVIYSVENSVCTASEIRKIYEAWQIYRQGQKPKVHYVTKSDRQPHELEVSIPGDAHNPRSLDYVTEYFPVASSEDLNAAFRQIAGRITAQAQVPTQVSGGDPVHGGYIAYTDPIGEYMEVKDVKTILFSGKRFDRLLDPVTETRADGGSVTTYRFEGQVNSPVYGQHSLSEIQITLETAVDPAGVKEQVLRVKIPASVIPLRVNTITLGGDGTLIQAARDLAGLNIPILGINLGTLVYLTQGNGQDVQEILEALLSDHYVLERRLMLKGRKEGQDGTDFQDIALNEIVVTRKDSMKVTKLSVSVNGRFFSSYTANGVILSTPTGSTAYNLSAGGPIAAPNCRIMILTSICSHTLNMRSIVLCADDIVRIEILDGGDGEQTAVFDGDTAVDMSKGDVIEISRSAVETIMVKLNDESFLDNVRNKMAGI